VTGYLEWEGEEVSGREGYLIGERREERWGGEGGGAGREDILVSVIMVHQFTEQI
jgi:hypothetical protein